MIQWEKLLEAREVLSEREVVFVPPERLVDELYDGRGLMVVPNQSRVRRRLLAARTRGR